MRESLCELALGLPAHRLTAASHYALTAALSGAAYAVSLAVPSIYVRAPIAPRGAGLASPAALGAAGVEPASLPPLERCCFCARAVQAHKPQARASPVPASPEQALLALVGSTACATFSLFFPAALVWRCRPGNWPARAGACGLAGLGAAMAAMAVYNQLHGMGE